MNAPTQQRARRLVWPAWIALVAVEVTTQLAFKFLGSHTGAFDFSAHAFGLAITSVWLWVALCGYCAGFVTWMLILRDSDLSRAFPASAIVFVAVILAAWLVLGESIGGVQMIGAAVIVAGILQLGRDGPIGPPQAAPVIAHPITPTE
jgi:drug/metabolite transporter (DMT)-like permease